MKYLIDDANHQHIEETLSMGIYGITANPSMYKNNQTTLPEFINHYKKQNLPFLSAEVMSETLEDLIKETEKILEITNDVVIKINFSKEGLQLCDYLHKKGVRTAMTLVFTLTQVNAAINAGADYIFFFIGRNDEFGNDGIDLIYKASLLCKTTQTKIVAASIKHLQHLHALCEMDIDFAAIPYNLYMKSLEHPLTTQGYLGFKKDWQ